MSKTTDPGLFFQTDASEAARARRAAKSGNKNGYPIVLQSKILDVIADPFSPSCVYIAESAGCVRRVNIETRDVTAVYRGPLAPVTSVSVGAAYGSTVFAGCWDKDIWAWDRESKSLKVNYRGHSDFVKAILCARISGKHFLISGGADAKIIVWDTATGNRIHTLRDTADTMRAVQFLTVDPVDTTYDELVLVSASSDPQIRRWRISLSSASQIIDKGSEESSNNRKFSNQAIREHETSIYQLCFDNDEGDLWTASADGTAKCLSRARNWVTEEIIKHGDYVRAVAVSQDWVITAGRDEDVKVWERSTGKLFHIYDGHFEEVTGLVVLDDGRKIVSVSIDGTIRTWSLTRDELIKARIEKEESKNSIEENSVQKETLMTADEEAELAELMDDEE